jgi:adhesin HecA-like repeat protein
VGTFKSAAVVLTPAYRAAAFAAVGAAAAACSPEPPPVTPDPCARVTFEAQACETAHRQQGYYYHGGWIPHIYPMPYVFYLGGYRNYAAAGGRHVAPPRSVYMPTYQAPGARAVSYLDRVSGRGAVPVGNPGAVVNRGGFGQTRGGVGARSFATGSAFALATEGAYGGRHGAVAGSRVGGAARLGGPAGRAFSGVTHAAGSRAVSRGGFGRTGGGRGGFGRGIGA